MRTTHFISLLRHAILDLPLQALFPQLLLHLTHAYIMAQHILHVEPLLFQHIPALDITSFKQNNLQFLLKAANSINYIVKTCLKSTRYNSNTYFGYKLTLYHYNYSLDMHDSYTASMNIIRGQNLSDYQSSIVNNLSTLIEMRSGNNVKGLTLNEINQMIEITVTN